jgi:hypothetical protein
MELRPVLMPPALDEAKVARLAGLAGHLDGAGPGQWEDELAEFNREAGTELKYEDFQKVYTWTDHETWVRIVLSRPAQRPIPDISRAELLELLRRICTADGREHEIDFWLGMLKANVPDPKVSDLLFWPGEYFGDGDNSRELSPEQILDIALSAGRKGDG